MKEWIRTIKKLGACRDAVEWAEQYDSLGEAWAKCERGDWMLWLAGQLSGEAESPERKLLVFTACQCARLALPYVPAGEDRPRISIETTEAWTRGEATIDQVNDAATDAADATDAATGAAHAAHAADAATGAAHAAHAASLKQCADVVRQYYPKPPEVK